MPTSKSPFWVKTKEPDEVENTGPREPTEIQCHVVDDADSGPADSGSERNSELDNVYSNPASPSNSDNGEEDHDMPEIEKAMADVQVKTPTKYWK